MRFDPFQWQEVTNAKAFEVPKGRLRVRCSKESAVYVAIEGYEALLGVGTAFDAELSETARVSVNAPSGSRVFVALPDGSTSVKQEGETFTNIDRMPHESGMLSEVMRARRLLEMEQRRYLREIRAEREKLKKPQPAPEPPPEPAPEPAPDPEPEPASEPVSAS